jgi:hypothetical protein
MMRHFEFQNASVAVWSGAPTLQDCERALVSARECFDRNGGQPIILIGVLMPDVKMPSEAVHKRMGECWPLLFELSKIIQCVSLPGGFTAARILAMIGSVFNRHDRRVSIYRTLPAALQEVRRASPGFATAELEKLILAKIESYSTSP